MVAHEVHGYSFEIFCVFVKLVRTCQASWSLLCVSSEFCARISIAVKHASICIVTMRIPAEQLCRFCRMWVWNSSGYMCSWQHLNVSAWSDVHRKSLMYTLYSRRRRSRYIHRGIHVFLRGYRACSTIYRFDWIDYRLVPIGWDAGVRYVIYCCHWPIKGQKWRINPVQSGRILCSAHTLQLTVKYAVPSEFVMQTICSIRQTSNFFCKSTNGWEYLERAQRNAGLLPVRPVMDVDSRLVSTLLCLIGTFASSHISTLQFLPYLRTRSIVQVALQVKFCQSLNRHRLNPISRF